MTTRLFPNKLILTRKISNMQGTSKRGFKVYTKPQQYTGPVHSYSGDFGSRTSPYSCLAIIIETPVKLLKNQRRVTVRQLLQLSSMTDIVIQGQVITSDILHTISKYCPDLKKLRLHQDLISESIMQSEWDTFWRSFPRLEELDIDSCFMRNKKHRDGSVAIDSALTGIIKADTLQYFRAKDTFIISSNTFSLLGAHCTELHEVIACNTPFVNEKGMIPLIIGICHSANKYEGQSQETRKVTIVKTHFFRSQFIEFLKTNGKTLPIDLIWEGFYCSCDDHNDCDLCLHPEWYTRIPAHAEVFVDPGDHVMITIS